MTSPRQRKKRNLLRLREEQRKLAIPQEVSDAVGELIDSVFEIVEEKMDETILPDLPPDVVQDEVVEDKPKKENVLQKLNKKVTGGRPKKVED